MNGATTIQERLKDLRLNKGLKLEELAEQTGISKSALGSYEKDDYKEINHGNLILLADFYGVSLDYLFCRTENRAEINTPLRELHLSDEMVALLKSGRINNRLLCELATHKDFIKFLADIEIYVDGIATMQIQNLNALVDTVRHDKVTSSKPVLDKKYNIAVAGTGYVGLSIATLLSQHNHVTAVDIIPEKVDLINNRKSPIQDDYIEMYLAEKELDLTARILFRKLYRIHCFCNWKFW